MNQIMNLKDDHLGAGMFDARFCHEIRFSGLISCFHDLIFSFWTYYSNSFLMDYLSHSHFLTNFTPKEGNQEQPNMGLHMVSQIKQVYGTVYIYQRPGVLGIIPSRVGG